MTRKKLKKKNNKNKHTLILIPLLFSLVLWGIEVANKTHIISLQLFIQKKDDILVCYF